MTRINPGSVSLDKRMTTVREWLIIEDSRKNSVFAPAETQIPKGYIPRDVAERLLGRDLGRNQWFTREESNLMRSHPEWKTNDQWLDYAAAG
jgi:hypothetical protein